MFVTVAGQHVDAFVEPITIQPYTVVFAELQDRIASDPNAFAELIDAIEWRWTYNPEFRRRFFQLSWSARNPRPKLADHLPLAAPLRRRGGCGMRVETPHRDQHQRGHLRTERGSSVAYQVIGDGPRDLIFVPGIVSHVEFFISFPATPSSSRASLRCAWWCSTSEGTACRIESWERRVSKIEWTTSARSWTPSAASEPRCSVCPKAGRSGCCSPRRTRRAVEAVVLYEAFACYGGSASASWRAMPATNPNAHKAFTDFMMGRTALVNRLLGFGTSRIDEPHVVTHHGVAAVLHHLASRAPHGLGEQPVVFRHCHRRGLGVRAPQLSVALDVREQERRGLARVIRHR